MLVFGQMRSPAASDHSIRGPLSLAKPSGATGNQLAFSSKHLAKVTAEFCRHISVVPGYVKSVLFCPFVLGQ
jgi:hypothetical protein